MRNVWSVRASEFKSCALAISNSNKMPTYIQIEFNSSSFRRAKQASSRGATKAATDNNIITSKPITRQRTKNVISIALRKKYTRKKANRCSIFVYLVLCSLVDFYPHERLAVFCFHGRIPIAILLLQYFTSDRHTFFSLSTTLLFTRCQVHSFCCCYYCFNVRAYF